jgi:mannose-6-phosphate isomerase
MWYVASRPARILDLKKTNAAEYVTILMRKLDFYLDEVVEGDAFSRNRYRSCNRSGLVIAEIQQTSDITYRLYDFDRRCGWKQTRIHVDLALRL